MEILFNAISGLSVLGLENGFAFFVQLTPVPKKIMCVCLLEVNYLEV